MRREKALESVVIWALAGIAQSTMLGIAVLGGRALFMLWAALGMSDIPLPDLSGRARALLMDHLAVLVFVSAGVVVVLDFLANLLPFKTAAKAFIAVVIWNGLGGLSVVVADFFLQLRPF